MFTWTKQSIKWYKEAVLYNRYAEKVAALIRPYLKPDWHVCDLGCGLGYLGAALAASVDKVTAVDIDEDALSNLNQTVAERNLKNIDIICTDYRRLPREKQFDCVVLSFFGRITENLDDLVLLANKQIIYMIAGENKDNFLPKREKTSTKESIEQAAKFLTRRGVSFKLHKDKIEFGQPFVSKDDAFQFLRHYSPMVQEDVIASYMEGALIELDDDRYRYYLRNSKEIGIFVIEV